MLEGLLAADALTISIAPVVGAYLCLSAAGLMRAGRASAFLDDLRRSSAAMHALGAIAFLVGAGLLALHRHWSTPAEITLNLVAAWWAFEGAGMLADPARIRAVMEAHGSARWFARLQLGAVPIGLYLITVGVVGNLG